MRELLHSCGSLLKTGEGEDRLPYHHADHYNAQIKRRCDCGGEPEMIVDFVADFIVRCKNCHASTMAYIYPEEAIEDWNLGNDAARTPLDLLIDDLEKNLSGEVLYMAMDEETTQRIDRQSFLCEDALIVMRGRILGAEHERNEEKGAIGFDLISDFDEKAYNIRITPKEHERFELDRIRYSADGSVSEIRYCLGDGFVVLTSGKDDMIVTVSTGE